MHKPDPRYMRDKELTLQISKESGAKDSDSEHRFLKRTRRLTRPSREPALFQLVFQFDPTHVQLIDPLLRRFQFQRYGVQPHPIAHNRRIQ